MSYGDWKQVAWKKDVERISRELNVQVLRCLGEGTWGVAYEIPENRVLKLTEHDTEINNSIKLKGRKNRYLADVYDVYVPAVQPCAIIREKLEIIPLAYFLDFDAAHTKAYGEYTGWCKVMRDGFDERNYKYFASNNAGDVYVGLINVFNEAALKGIDIRDLHSGNLGLKSDGRMALFDIS